MLIKIIFVIAAFGFAFGFGALNQKYGKRLMTRKGGRL